MGEFQSLERAIAILFSFTKEQQQLSAEEIAQRVDLPKGSIYRYINALLKHGLLEKVVGTTEYRYGYRLLYFSSVIGYRNILDHISTSYLERLAEATRETVSLTTIHGDNSVVIKQIESNATVRVAPIVGMPGPIHAGANNKVIIAFRPESEWERVCRMGLRRMTPHTITDCDEFRAELRRIRTAGYAVSDQEMHVGAWGVSAPILDANGYAIASIGVSGPTFRYTEEVRQTSIRLTVEYGKAISDELRYSNHTME